MFNSIQKSSYQLFLCTHYYNLNTTSPVIGLITSLSIGLSWVNVSSPHGHRVQTLLCIENLTSMNVLMYLWIWHLTGYSFSNLNNPFCETMTRCSISYIRIGFRSYFSCCLSNHTTITIINSNDMVSNLILALIMKFNAHRLVYITCSCFLCNASRVYGFLLKFFYYSKIIIADFTKHFPWF